MLRSSTYFLCRLDIIDLTMIQDVVYSERMLKLKPYRITYRSRSEETIWGTDLKDAYTRHGINSKTVRRVRVAHDVKPFVVPEPDDEAQLSLGLAGSVE